jgi:segregation and condensation protein A
MGRIGRSRSPECAPARAGRAISTEDLAWEGPGRQAPPDNMPVLRVEGFEGPLDWLLEQVRAHRVDLARLPVLALIEQCVTAIEAALAGRHGAEGGEAGASSAAPAPVPLQRLADWVVMAAWLAWLRSRLLLPEDDPQATAAREEAEALRRQLANRAWVRGAAAWLDAQPQLGRDVFARGGGVPTRASAAAERAADLPVLLRTYARLMGPLPEQEKADVYRPRPPPLWRVPDAIARITRLLPELPDGSTLTRFLPQVALEPPQYDLRCRSAVASTLVAGLELARQGQLTLGQEESFGGIQVRAGQDAAMATEGAADH